jgi:hypothetical protein
VQDKLLLETSLERAAEAVGDITSPAMARFYEAFPAARASFEHHGLGNPEALEAQMVESALYCAMGWLEHREEVRIVLEGSVPHHQETLKVPLNWFRGLMDSVIDVLVETVPPDAHDELRVWAAVRRGLDEVIEASSAILAPTRSAPAEPALTEH